MNLKRILSSFIVCCFVSPVFADAPVYDANPIPLSQNQAPATARASGQMQNQNYDPAILLDKINQQQQEIQGLRGKLEEQAHETKMLRDQQRAFYQDLNERMNQMASTPANRNPANTSSKPQVGIDSLKTDLSAVTVESAQTQAQTDKQSYEAAYKLIEDKQFPAAISAMQKFLENYPESDYASNGHYWLGELYLTQGKYQEAITEFNTVLQGYPKSSKFAPSMLKLGFAYFDNGQWKESRTILQNVMRRYPNSSLARLAKQRIKDMEKAQNE